MAGPNKWDDEEQDSSSSEHSAPTGAVSRRKFDDEEGDSDVLDSWDAAEDSEVEREKAKKAAEAKAKAEAEAQAKKKSKTQRIAERLAARAQALAEDSSSEEEETEAEKRQRMRGQEKEADLRHAEDLFGDVGVSAGRKTAAGSTVIVLDSSDPTKTVDLANVPLFNPVTKTQFEALRGALVPVLGAQARKAHYVLFLQELTKQLAKDLPSDQIKKISTTLTTLSNEKMKEEKAADKGGKKSKAQKTKSTLAGVSRGPTADTNTYEDTFGDDDFM